MRLNFDFEVYSEIGIKSAPLDVYASHPSTKIILCAYAFDDGPVEIWEAHKGKAPQMFRVALVSPWIDLVAWNIGYERTVLRGRGVNIPIERWVDPMVHARYASLPGRLKDCAKIPMIGVPAEEKTKSETLLINKFCMPNKEGRRVMPDEYPDDWQKFVNYCRNDVLTMRHIHRWLTPRFPFPESERELWLLDQRINERGLPVDTGMATRADKLVREIVQANLKRQKELTGLENPNSIQQLMEWLKGQGYPYDSLGKEFVQQSLDDPEGNLTEEAQEVLSLRLQSGKSSVKKFRTLVERTGPDGRLRNQFVFNGAHTGRWSARDVQPHNLTRKATDPEALKAIL